MIAAFESLLPVFLLIGLGFILRFKHVVPEDMWRGVELLSYWVFFPALLAETLIRADLRSLPLTGITLTMAATFFTMVAFLLTARRWLMGWLALGGPSYSSLFQNAVRWNGFIALPILAKLYGDTGVALVAVVMGVLVPLANFAAVIVVAHNASARKLTTRETLFIVFRNPFIWSTAIGLAINLAGIPIYEPVMTTMHTLGAGAVGTGLLMVGSGLRAEEAVKPTPAVWWGTGLKLFGTPILVTLWSFVFDISGVAFVACIVCAAVPTATSAYVLARQMGGDAPLIAATVSVQTIVSFFSIPIMIWLAANYR
jgi:malonate transporter and related proteins